MNEKGEIAGNKRSVTSIIGFNVGFAAAQLWLYSITGYWGYVISSVLFVILAFYCYRNQRKISLLFKQESFVIIDERLKTKSVEIPINSIVDVTAHKANPKKVLKGIPNKPKTELYIIPLIPQFHVKTLSIELKDTIILIGCNYPELIITKFTETYNLSTIKSKQK